MLLEILLLAAAAPQPAPIPVTPVQGHICQAPLTGMDAAPGARAALMSDGEGFVLMLEAKVTRFGPTPVMVDGASVPAVVLNNSDEPDGGSVWVDGKLAERLAQGTVLDLPFTQPRTRLSLAGVADAMPRLLVCARAQRTTEGG